MNIHFSNRFILSLCMASFLLTACNDDEKKATDQLQLAQTLYTNGNLNQAKLEIDNIRQSFPKEYKIIRQGNQLMRRIELAEQERNIAYCDSLSKAYTEKIDSLTQGFILEKDPEYDEIGHWIYQTQTIEKNFNQTYLRATVDEKGNIALASVYHGTYPLKHQAVRATTGDGEYTETNTIPQDGANNYTFQDGGLYSEIVTFKNGSDNGLIQFICADLDSKIKVTLLASGKDKHKYILSKENIKAIKASYNLAAVLTEIEKMKSEIDLAKVKIDYLKNKIAEADSITLLRESKK